MEQHGLREHLGCLGAAQHGLHLGQREAVLGPERQDDRVVVGGRLQLEVEGDAEPLAQGQTERAVDASTERRVDDQLRALALVEAALDDNALVRRQVAECRQAGGAVGDDLLGHLGRDAGALLHEPAGGVTVVVRQQRLERGAQIAHRLGELRRPGRSLAEPEGNGRGQVPGIVHTDRADLDLGHAPRMRAEKEDVARRRLDGEVLVDGADRHPVGIEYHPVVAGLGDGAPTGERRQPGSPPGPQPPVHRVEVQVRAAPPAAGLDTPAGQRHHVVEVLARQLRVRGRVAGHLPHRLDVALVGGGHLGDQLLGQDVERRDRGFEQVQPALPDGGEECRALDELVTRRRVEPPGRRAVAMVVGPADPLEEGADGAGRSDLAHQFDRADVNAQLERRGGDQRAQVAGPQARLDDAAACRREAPVVRGHQQRGIHVAPGGRRVLAEPLGQLMGHPLGHLARVDEDEGRAVIPRVLGDAVEDVRHLAAAHDGLELGRGQLNGHLEVTGVAAVDDHGRWSVVVHAREEPRHQVERPLGGREPDALETAAALGHQGVQPLEAQRQMAAPLVAGQRVHLVDDHRPHAAQERP